MDCKYFGECGACRVYENGYEAQLNEKKELNEDRFLSFYDNNISVFKSLDSHYRSRSEFKIWHLGDEIHYGMNHIDKKGVVLVDECPQVNEHISVLMPKLLKEIEAKKIGFKLFGTDFLSSTSGEIVVSLIYHRKLDKEWEVEAAKVAAILGIYIIGRSRKQKLVIGQDYVTESLMIDTKLYKFNHIENSFTQPNPRVNEQMISWAMKNFSNIEGDLLELYCGAGNFTIPFSSKFEKVLATEISKSSINAAKANMLLNDISNIEFVRLNATETAEALNKEREFRRLKGIELDEYNFSTVLVDPPRAGLDEASLALVQKFNNIVYISCNPDTLARDLEELTNTHKIVKAALFDQFPYTHHIESGVYLERITK